MGWGLGVGIVIVFLLFAFFGLIIFKETRTHRFWRAKVEEGDLEMITQLVQVEVDHWRAERPAKGTPASVYQGIQSVEIGEIGADYVRVSSTAEPQFALVGGERRQVSSALDEAKRIIASLAERFFYEIPHVRLDRVQIDIYTTFHGAGGEATQQLILSAIATRDAAADVDWDDDPADVIAERLGARYDVDQGGTVRPIQPDESAVRTAVDGSRRNGSSTERGF